MPNCSRRQEAGEVTVASEALQDQRSGAERKALISYSIYLGVWTRLYSGDLTVSHVWTFRPLRNRAPFRDVVVSQGLPPTHTSVA
jgi:hypothetical protein